MHIIRLFVSSVSLWHQLIVLAMNLREVTDVGTARRQSAVQKVLNFGSAYGRRRSWTPPSPRSRH